MKLQEIVLHKVWLPLVAPFQTSFMTETHRDALLVSVRTSDGIEGWGECVAMQEPCFSAEYFVGAVDVIQRFLKPLLEGLPEVTAETAGAAFGAIKGHPMAKAAVETAILDAQLQGEKQSLAAYLGATRDEVPAGVSVGIMESVSELLGAVGVYKDAGYKRVKLKIQPGWDVEPVEAVREKFPDVPLQVDANGAYTYTRKHVDALVRLDSFGLLMIEQPFAYDDLWSHVKLGKRLKNGTPICLDESVTSPAEAIAVIRMKAAQVINIKPGRVGGYLKAKEIHDVCAGQKTPVPVWIGGMLETGIGRAANLALAAMPNFTLVGDVSASDRFFEEDITAPFVMRDGCIAVPDGPGIGVEPDKVLLKKAARGLKPIIIPIDHNPRRTATNPLDEPMHGFGEVVADDEPQAPRSQARPQVTTARSNGNGRPALSKAR